MKMVRTRAALQLVALQALIILLSSDAQSIPPSRLDGFLYKNHFHFDNVLIEAFYDPVCPDSRDSWPPLKQALHFYGLRRVSLLLHLLPLPYHDNAFAASRALHVVHSLNESATFPLLEWFFENQEQFYTAQTRNLSRVSIVEKIVKSATLVAGSSYYNDIKNGFNETASDYQTRVSFKYAASRGVWGTPFFYVNGFLLPDYGYAIDYKTWRKILDPLVGAKKNVKNEESPHLLL